MKRYVLMNDSGSIIHNTADKAEALRMRKKLGHSITMIPTADIELADIRAKIAFADRQPEGDYVTLH